MTNERAQRIVDLADREAESDVADAAPDPEDESAPTAEPLTGETPSTDAPTSEALTTTPDDQTSAIEAETDDDPEAVEAIEAADDGSDLDQEDPEPVDDDAELIVAEAESEIEDSSNDGEAEDQAAPADEEPEAPPVESLPRMLEALLFVADEPVAPSVLGRTLELTPAQIRRGLDDLAESLRDEERGVRLQQGPDGAQLVTAPDLAPTVELFLGLEASRRLSSAALETLAIIAYRQPVTRHVIDQIRGVSSDGAVARLRARGLIEGVGRAPGPGRPLLFSTTQRFLEHFGLERPDQLPPLPDDMELPPEVQDAQLALEGAVTAEVATTEDDEVDDPLAVDEAAPADTADDEDDNSDADDGSSDDERESGPTALEEGLDLELSDDLSDLSQAAGVALAGSTDGPDRDAHD